MTNILTTKVCLFVKCSDHTEWYNFNNVQRSCRVFITGSGEIAPIANYHYKLQEMGAKVKIYVSGSTITLVENVFFSLKIIICLSILQRFPYNFNYLTKIWLFFSILKFRQFRGGPSRLTSISCITHLTEFASYLWEPSHAGAGTPWQKHWKLIRNMDLDAMAQKGNLYWTLHCYYMQNGPIMFITYDVSDSMCLI